MTLDIDEIQARYQRAVNRHAYGPPLPPVGAYAALQVVLGVVPLEHAANAVGVDPDDLVQEALAWSAALEFANQQVL
jgi:hypothetical protein